MLLRADSDLTVWPALIARSMDRTMNKITPTTFVVLLTLTSMLCLSGCRGRQHAHVLAKTDEDMIGSHEAGAETWKPLINEAVAKMLGRDFIGIEREAAYRAVAEKRINNTRKPIVAAVAGYAHA